MLPLRATPTGRSLTTSDTRDGWDSALRDPPGRLHRMSDETGGAVQSRLWRDGALAAVDFPFEQISDYLEEDGALVWVDICDPNPQRLQELAEELTLDPHAVVALTV